MLGVGDKVGNHPEWSMDFKSLENWKSMSFFSSYNGTPLSRKLFKLEEPDMQDTAGEVGKNS